MDIDHIKRSDRGFWHDRFEPNLEDVYIVKKKNPNVGANWIVPPV